MTVNLKKATTQTQETKKVMSVFLTNLAQYNKENKNDMEVLSDHLIEIVERNNKRFSFEGGVCNPEQAKIEIFDKEKEIGYIVKIDPIEYDENGKPVNI